MLVLKYKHNNNISQKWGISGGEMTKRKKTIVAAFAILGIAVVGLAAGVYAKYIATITGSGTAQVAKWAFSGDNTTDVVKCDLSHTYDPTTLVDKKIAPGTEGVCTIELKNNSSEVGVHYKIVASATNKPTNLKFYTDDTYRTELTAAGIEGNIAAKAAESVKTYIYWVWPYETTGGDEIDTSEGANALSMGVDFTITGTQVAPVAQ